MLEPITYKQVLDKDGDLEYIELWQGENHIKISLVLPTPFKSMTKWSEIKPVIDNLVAKARRDVKAMGIGNFTDDGNGRFTPAGDEIKEWRHEYNEDQEHAPTH